MSSAPISNAQQQPRKSFAQVAAAAHTPIRSKDKPTNKPSNIQNVQSSPQGAPKAFSVRLEPEQRHIANGVASAGGVSDKAEVRNNEPQQLPVLLQRIRLQNNSAVVSGSDLIARKEPDTKSVASRTTITLDEKESLRPDDSASIQAALEEDAFSPSGSIVAESRESSDPDVKAFREQLNVIDRTGAAAAAGITQPPLILPISANDVRAGVVICPTVPIAVPAFDSRSVTLVERPIMHLPPNAFVVPPDEKLLEALASPKDRLFVLKIEQDFIDFIKDSKEEYLQLPQTNSFYRMLSHKLADYYSLGHFVDESLTSVRIYKTAHSRLPPPLIGPASTGDGSTPPPTGPARKIMRRVLDRENIPGPRSGEVKLFGSQSSSKAPSDNGAGSGGDDMNDDITRTKDKASLTREERENRYKEARARIFKDFKEEPAEPNDGTSGSVDKEVSRSSSASGMKKSKKPKKPKDDGFEARSAYSQYGNQTFQTNGLTSPASDSPFYNPFAPYALGNYDAHALRPQEPSLQSPNPLYSPYGQQDPSAIGVWQNAPQSQAYIMPQTPGNSYFSGQGSYDTSHAYGSAFGSFPSPNGANSLTPKFAQPQLSGFATDYMAPNDRIGWGQNAFQNGYGANETMYNNGTSGMAGIGFMPNTITYPPSSTYDGASMTTQQMFSTPPPNGFDRQQFNPRSQAFIPSTRGPMTPQGQSNVIPSFINSTPRPSNSIPIQRQVSDASQNAGYNLMQAGPQNPNGVRGNGPSQLRSQAQNARQPQASFSNSISKWGNPSTLPPKPPPPAIPSPYLDPHNQQSLPPNPYSNTGRAAAGSDAGVQTAH